MVEKYAWELKPQKLRLRRQKKREMGFWKINRKFPSLFYLIKKTEAKNLKILFYLF